MEKSPTIPGTMNLLEEVSEVHAPRLAPLGDLEVLGVGSPYENLPDILASLARSFGGEFRFVPGVFGAF
ncbi:MAG: hypothetical protein KGI27_13805 [Thaumarchaeota archaeon]|nr:hypothetical protein [Nitrososphaerota archaeon]